MNLYWKAQILATLGMGGFGAWHWAERQMHLNATLPVSATVEKIDRTWLLVDNGSGASGYGSCGQRAFFNKQAFATGHREDLEGVAKITLFYTAPQDGSFRSGSIELTGHDDGFYALKAGDRLSIRVDKADPAVFTTD